MELASPREAGWEQDSASSTCRQCSSSFGILRRKHHCRACGKLNCADCLDNFKIPNTGVTGPRICLACYPTYDKLAGEPARGPVPAGITRICVAGYGASPHYTRANNVGLLLCEEFPQFEYWTHSPSRDEFFIWLVGWKETVASHKADSGFQKHRTSPICWFEKEDGSVVILGGRDRFVEWISANHPGSKADKKGDALINPFESSKQVPPPKPAFSATGQKRICVIGYGVSPNYTRARNVGALLATEFPNLYSTWTFGPSREEFFEWLAAFKATLPADSPWLKHKTSPFCYFEGDDGTQQVIGGRDKLVEWTNQNHPGSKADKRGGKTLNPFEQNL